MGKPRPAVNRTQFCEGLKDQIEILYELSYCSSSSKYKTLFEIIIFFSSGKYLPGFCTTSLSPGGFCCVCDDSVPPCTSGSGSV